MNIRGPQDPQLDWWKQTTFQRRWDYAHMFGDDFDLYLVGVGEELRLNMCENLNICGRCGSEKHYDDPCRCEQQR